jgi:aspartate racemase
MGTRFTMEQDFYRGVLAERGLDVLVPDDDGRTDTHRIIYEELCLGRTEAPSRARYEAITREGLRAGADSVILGCTEVCMLLSDANSALPTFDTTTIHARALIDAALA